MALPVEQDVPSYPVHVRFFGAPTQMSGPDGDAHTIEQLWRWHRHVRMAAECRGLMECAAEERATCPQTVRDRLYARDVPEGKNGAMQTGTAIGSVLPMQKMRGRRRRTL